MRQRMSLISFVLIVALVSFPIWAQITIESKTFEKEGISFSYPSGWTLVDKSDSQKQNLLLTRENTFLLIAITAYRQPVSTFDQFDLARRAVTEPYIESLARTFGTPDRPAQPKPSCTELNFFKTITGSLIRGSYQNEQTTAEVYALAKGGRFINLAYLRSDKESAQGDVAWEMIRKTLTLTTDSSDEALINVIGGGVLNGRALDLPRPEYPGAARSAHVAGRVEVQVTIDERGRVISAEAVSGPPLLRSGSVQAARHARFSPTLLCNEPVKVTGVIIYNFLAH